jgi:L-2-hydroxyglutarate oxidase LhgO
MNKKFNILIIGCGIVGLNVKRKLSKFNPDVIDKYK